MMCRKRPQRPVDDARSHFFLLTERIRFDPKELFSTRLRFQCRMQMKTNEMIRWEKLQLFISSSIIVGLSSTVETAKLIKTGESTRESNKIISVRLFRFRRSNETVATGTTPSSSLHHHQSERKKTRLSFIGEISLRDQSTFHVSWSFIGQIKGRRCFSSNVTWKGASRCCFSPSRSSRNVYLGRADWHVKHWIRQFEDLILNLSNDFFS